MACIASDGQGHVHVVALGHRNLGGRGAAFILELTKAEGEQLGFGDLGDHFGQFLLLKLEATDGSVKLNALLGVAKGCVVAVHGCTDGAPGDAVAGRIQAAQGSPQAGFVRQEILLGNFHVVEDELTGGGGAQRPFVVGFRRREAFHATLDNEAVDAALFVFGPYYCNMAERCIGNPHFGSV